MTMRTWKPEPRRILGWKFSGLVERKSGDVVQIKAAFDYAVEVRNPQTGIYEHSERDASDIMRPHHQEFTLADLERVKQEGLFITAVSPKLVDQGIQAFENQGNVLQMQRLG